MSTFAAAVTAIAVEARERSDEIEAKRSLPEDLGQRMASGGVFRMLVPQCHAGLEVHPSTFARALAELGYADGATGWCAMVGSTTGLLAASLPEHWSQMIYGEHPDTITCGVTAPLGKAVAAGEHWRVNGRWPFGSASRNAEWICGGCLVLDDEGKPVAGRHGVPDITLMYFHRDKIRIHDNWHVSGLQGTGSSDFEVCDVLVPRDRCVTMGSRPRVAKPLYQFPTLGLLAIGVASVALGIGRRAVDELVDLAGGKVPTGSRRRLADRATVQADVGRADAALKAADAFIHAAIDRAWAVAETGAGLGTEHKAELRAAAAHATWAAVDAVDRAYHAGGGSAIYRESALQRCFRDVHVATQHIMVAQPIFEVTGRIRLGLEPGGPL